jgi:bifunctional N-acetylglucosamine-1-phosphate-uridyltransferase/glucosamine-1-phosphate-acetyltransferase GlmU-like protein
MAAVRWQIGVDAPVILGKGSVVAAGAVVTKDVQTQRMAPATAVGESQ